MLTAARTLPSPWAIRPDKTEPLTLASADSDDGQSDMVL